MVMPGNQTGLPPELYGGPKGRVSMADFMRQWQNEDPAAMYIAQLTDYLATLVTAGEMTPDKAGDILKTAKNWATFPIDPSLWQIDGAPSYDTVIAASANQPGPTVKANYRALLDELDATVRKLQTQVMTPQGQIAVNDAINRGLITREEAYEQNPYWQYYSQVQAQKEQKAEMPQRKLNQEYGALQKRAIELGIDTTPYATETPDVDIYKQLEAVVKQAESQRQTVAQGAAAGYEKIYNQQAGYGQPQSPDVQQMQRWAQTINPATGTYYTEDEARQKVAAAQRGQNEAARTWNPSSDAMAGLIHKAQLLGMDVSNLTPYNATPGGVEALNNQITNIERRGREFQSTLLSKQFPNEYRAWEQELGKGYGGTGLPMGYQAGFAGWANAKGTEESPLTPAQEAFQKQRTALETQNWQKYGSIYGEYRKYLAGLTNPEEYKPLTDWINATPQIKAVWDEEQKAEDRRRLFRTTVPRPTYMR